jgi:hypothetical protein
MTPSLTPPASIAPANPFPLEAVAQYGPVAITCTGLEYFDRALSELNNYLAKYPDRATRYGGAIPLRGAHGSGKTHLLSWLAERARMFTSIRATTVYAKADAPSFANLYAQFMAQLESTQLVKIIEQALVVLAQEIAGRTKVTEGLVPRLKSAEDIQRLAAERNVDREQLLVELRGRLLVKDIPDQIPQTLLRLLDAVVADDAYRWLTGAEIPGAKSVGLSPSLGSATDGTRMQSDRELACIQALQIIARLHRVADVPFVLCVDQLEGMIPVDDASTRQTVFSLLKKFVEQIGSEDALIFVAGSDDVWPMLSRDIAPRFRRREPIIVGNLSTPEVGALLVAYSGPTGSAEFAPEAFEPIRELSGGNPREVLRIAHAAWHMSDGTPRSVSKEMLVASAHESGTVADRARVALAIVDRIFNEVGKSSPEVAADADSRIDRLLLKDDTVRAALILVSATDKLAEISSARHAAAARQYCELTWPSAALITVAIGYSSAQVADILGTTTRVVVFNETNFAGELRAIVHGLPASADQGLEAAHARNAALTLQLREMSERLAALESQRQAEHALVDATLVERVDSLSKPRRDAQVLQSRWQMLQALDDLTEACARNRTGRERALVHSLLVSNETYLKAPRVERIGAIYLDALRLGRVSDEQSTQKARRQLIEEFRRALRPRSWVERTVRDRRVMAVLAATAFGSWALVTFGREYLPFDTGYWLRLASFAATGLLVIQAYMYFILSSARGRSLSRIERTLRESPYAAALEATPFSVRSEFPQSS